VDFLRRFALACVLLALGAASAEAEDRTLYVWGDRLILFAAPNFSAAIIKELPYGSAVQPLGSPGPLVPGIEHYPPVRDSVDKTKHPLHGRWLKLRSRTEPTREGYAFDTYLLPLPTPHCETGRSSCDPVTTLGWSYCPDKATNCESAEAYSARIFGFVSQDRDDRAGAYWINHYAQGVKIEDFSEFDGEILMKRWTLPMLNSIDQGYVVMQRFFGRCWYLYAYEPTRQIQVAGCGEIGNANVILSVNNKAVIDWGFMD
jgi:hypothetical protein